MKEQWRDCRSSWYRPPQDWEEVSFDWFLAIVYSRKVWGVGFDKVCWKPARSRGFEVRSFFLSTPYYLLSLEVGVTIEGPSKGGFLFMVSLFR